MKAPFEEFDVENTAEMNEFIVRCLPEVFIGIENTQMRRKYFIIDAIREKLDHERED